jgi:hypothetical protein
MKRFMTALEHVTTDNDGARCFCCGHTTWHHACGENDDARSECSYSDISIINGSTVMANDEGSSSVAKMSCDDGSDPREECPTAKLINQMYNESLVSFLKTVSGEGVTGNLHTRAAFVDFVKAIRGRQQTGNPSSSPSGRAPLVGGTSTPTPTPGLSSSARSQRGEKRTPDILPARSSRSDALMHFLRDYQDPAFTQAEADRRIDSISNYFKTIMNRDVSQSSIHAVNVVDIYALTTKGKRLEEVLKCLGIS